MVRCAYDEHMGFETHGDPGSDPYQVSVALGPDGHDLSNPVGALHGGVIAGLADSAMGHMMTARLGPDEVCTNIDLDVRFLRFPRGDRITATGRVLLAIRTVNVLHADVHDAEGHLVATVDSTFLRLAAR